MLASDLRKLLQDELNEKHIQATQNLSYPPNAEFARDVHEIGVSRGFIRALYEMNKFIDYLFDKEKNPEKYKEKKPDGLFDDI